MLDFIKKNYQIGNQIEITTSAGVYTGQIEFINPKYIVLRQDNGKICGIAGSDIFTFKADIPEEILEGKTEWLADDEAPASAADTVKVPVDTVPAVSLEQADAVETTVADGEDETEQLSAISTVEPKIVGHIDLDKLQKIDPKFSNRKYFSHADGPESEKNGGNAFQRKEEFEEEETDNENEVFQHVPFVPAKGRVTYYNYEHRYGFIHDFASEADLYFKMHQIAEPMLLDRIRKGTKVVYSIDHNAQGPTANCLHLPHPVNTLFIIAENCMDSYKYYFAREILEHVLEVYPDNKDAQEMLEEASQPEQSAHPSAGSSVSYNPSLIYAQAKRAYLKKEYDEAERLYIQALEAKEKPESCVKDLITLYVSCFKQAENDDVKVQSREKALHLLQSYRDLLPDNMTTKQFLALNFYLPIGEYEKFIGIVDEILASPQVANIVSRRVFYLWQKGLALNKLGKTAEALALVDSTLELSPHNRQLLSLKNMIMNPETPDETPAEDQTVADVTEEEPVETEA